MPGAILDRVGRQFSSVLHHLIYSFPTPNSTDQAPPSPSPAANVGASDPKTSALDQYLEGPGEPRAFAGGVGPLSFAGSGYGITLILMAILLNRIQHIVRRPRIPPQPLPHPTTSLYHRTKAAISRALISPSAPKYLRLPGLFCLVRAWILFTILTLQVAKLWPTESELLQSSSYGRAVLRFGSWAGGMSMEEVCWQVFLSVCAGLVCSGFANGLDRVRRRDVPAGFNLFGYSFLLHLYSSPLTHHRPPPAARHGRPDVHALFQLWLSLTELTWLQAIELIPSPRKNQLLPTAICGGLGLAHFVYALSTSPLKFPSFTFLTHLMALFLFVIILFSIIVKGITHLFTLGYLPSPVFENLLPHESVMPSAEDDFGIALLKLGTACIEATQYSGLRNELVSITGQNRPWIELSTGDSKVHATSAGGLNTEITNVAVSQLRVPGAESAYWNQYKAFWTSLAMTMINLAWSMVMATPLGRKTVETLQTSWYKRWWYGPRHWKVWKLTSWREPPTARLRRRLRLQAHLIKAKVRSRPITYSSSASSTALELRARSPEPLPWRQYLQGEVDIPDDDDDWRDDDAISVSSVSSTGTDDNTNHLYSDLADDTADLQPVLLAHLTNSSSPLTRRRYAAIVAPPEPSITGPLALQQLITERRGGAVSTPRNDDDSRQYCVVCTVEARDTILWPCRCLALCNDCRESLAGRLPAKDHLCPCCRAKIEGYSRIYIP